IRTVPRAARRSSEVRASSSPQAYSNAAESGMRPPPGRIGRRRDRLEPAYAGRGRTRMRLRQVALVARSLEPVLRDLRRLLGLGEPFRDPGVGTFGLENCVLPLGDAFLEVVSPVKPDTTAGRWLDRRGGDTGYMAIFQTRDLPGARARIERLG